MNIGDRVRVINTGGLYRSFNAMADVFGIKNWQQNRGLRAEDEYYTIKGIERHFDFSEIKILLAHIENEDGMGYIMDLSSLQFVEEPFELGEELFLV